MLLFAFAPAIGRFGGASAETGSSSHFDNGAGSATYFTVSRRDVVDSIASSIESKSIRYGMYNRTCLAYSSTKKTFSMS